MGLLLPLRIFYWYRTHLPCRWNGGTGVDLRVFGLLMLGVETRVDGLRDRSAVSRGAVRPSTVCAGALRGKSCRRQIPCRSRHVGRLRRTRCGSRSCWLRTRRRVERRGTPNICAPRRTRLDRLRVCNRRLLIQRGVDIVSARRAHRRCLLRFWDIPAVMNRIERRRLSLPLVCLRRSDRLPATVRRRGP